MHLFTQGTVQMATDEILRPPVHTISLVIECVAAQEIPLESFHANN